MNATLANATLANATTLWARHAPPWDAAVPGSLALWASAWVLRGDARGDGQGVVARST